ncbi:MAG TPA: alpha/beta hydrolase [Anaerolineales bacterium]|nr:alpha/beta hydrolase [Anaerolineales bacterium]
MPVWVRGNIDSGTFIVFNHGGPGSCGTAESLFEVSPGNGQLDHASPLQTLENDYAVVYWDQRHSGMSRGSADPNDSRVEDFGEDLSLVIRELRARHNVQQLFLVGQSWGHTVVLSYLTLIDDWASNQAGVDGYIDYKGNHEQDVAYQSARTRVVEFANQEIAAGRDAAYWKAALQFYEQTPDLLDVADFNAHDEYAFRAMQVSNSTPERIWAYFKASIFSPLNGWAVYFNNKKTVEAEVFLKRVTTDTALSQTLPRLSIPVLLIYGAKDLRAPAEVGQSIYQGISTPEPQKTLLILPNSRHGAEGDDVPLMQTAIQDFIHQALMLKR